MRGRQAASDAGPDTRHLVGLETSLAREAGAEILAVDELHDHVGFSVLLAVVEDVDDVRM